MIVMEGEIVYFKDLSLRALLQRSEVEEEKMDFPTRSLSTRL